jgi:putative transposase
MRDTVVDFVAAWSAKTAIAQDRFIRWLGVSRGKFFDWKQRYGKANEHNNKVPRDHWLEKWEQQAILDYHHANPLEGYRRMVNDPWTPRRQGSPTLAEASG